MNNPFESIEVRLCNIESLLLDIKHHPKPQADQPDPDRWFDLNELCQYHPDKPQRSTVYGWVSAGLIPFHKSGKKLRFLKSEIDAWLMEGKKLTAQEADRAAKEYIKKKGALI